MPRGARPFLEPLERGRGDARARRCGRPPRPARRAPSRTSPGRRARTPRCARGERVLVAAEAVVQHRGRVARRAPSARPSPRAVASSRRWRRSAPSARPRGRARRRARSDVYAERRVAGRLGDRLGLLDQRRRGGELAGDARARRRGSVSASGRTVSAPASRASCDARASASSCQLSSSQRSRRDAARQPEPAQVVLASPAVVSRNALQRAPAAAARRPRSPSVNRVASPSRSRSIGRGGSRRRRRGPRGLGHLAHAAPRAEPAGEERRRERLEVGLARERRVERLEPLAASSSSGGRVAAARCARTRSARAAARAARAGARRAGPARRWRAARAPSSSAPASYFACAAASARCAAARRDRASARRRARGTRPRRRGRRAPGRGRPSARARRRPPRRARPPRAARCQARRSGSTLGIGRLGQRAVHLPALVRGAPRGRPPSAPADGGTRTRRADLDQPGRLGRRGRVGADPEPLGRAPQQRRVADRLGRRHEQQPLRVGREAPRAAAGSSPRSGSPAAARPAARTRRPAPPASARAAAPAARAGCRASRRRSGRAPARPAARDRRRPAARARRRRAGPRPRSSGRPASSRRSPGSRTANTSATDSASSRRATNASACAEARSSHCASSTTHSSGRSSAASDEQAEHGQPDEEAIRARRRRSARTRCRARRAAGRAAARGGRAAARTADAAPRTRSSISDSTPAARATRQPDARSTQVLQQRGLADARLAAHHEHAAPPAAHALQQPIERRRTPLAGRAGGRAQGCGRTRRASLRTSQRPSNAAIAAGGAGAAGASGSGLADRAGGDAGGHLGPRAHRQLAKDVGEVRLDVFSLRKSRSPISRLVAPVATSSATSRSRSLSDDSPLSAPPPPPAAPDAPAQPSQLAARFLTQAPRAGCGGARSAAASACSAPCTIGDRQRATDEQLRAATSTAPPTRSASASAARAHAAPAADRPGPGPAGPAPVPPPRPPPPARARRPDRRPLDVGGGVGEVAECDVGLHEPRRPPAGPGRVDGVAWRSRSLAGHPPPRRERSGRRR